MKKIFLLIIAIISFAAMASAQITTVLNVQSNPTAVISDWANQNAIINFIVTKTDSTPRPAIFKTEIRLLDGTVIATTDVSKAIPVTLIRGTRVYFSKDVLQLEIMQFNGKYKSTLERTGKLPADNYQLSVQLLQPGNYQPLVVERTKNFNVAALQLPILVMPLNNAVLNNIAAQTAITFRWSPLSPATTTLPTYRLQVFEVLPNQQNVQALRSNQPLLDILLKRQTHYIWRPMLAFDITDSIVAKFIWTIQTLDAQGLPAVQTDGNGESRSEPFVFTIQSMPIITIEKRKSKERRKNIPKD